MQFIKHTFKTSISVLIFLLFVTGCHKEDKLPDYTYFVSKELAVTLTESYINGLLNTASATIPELNNLKNLISDDVNVYRIIYKTTIDGKKVNVSGLMCVPATSGEYPVLSFQNGTNTLNSLAPSEFVINYPYQLVEIIASMGYVVVIPDYPGFGESSQIPHPYLIKEPTVRSLVDILYAVKECIPSDPEGITLKNEYYLIGYSQGGWATLALHKALELDFSSDFNLAGSACGAGPYDIYLLLQEMVNATTYPMPVYLGYIVNAYKDYNQFTNPVSDIFNEPYASRLTNLYTGLLGSDEINSQLTTSIPQLINSEFLSGFSTSTKYLSVRDALINNSILGWHTYKPLLLVHGENDKSVDPVSTQNMYNSMIDAGTSSDLCTKVIIPGADHGDGVVPFMIQGILFINNLKNPNMALRNNK